MHFPNFPQFSKFKNYGLVKNSKYVLNFVNRDEICKGNLEGIMRTAEHQL